MSARHLHTLRRRTIPVIYNGRRQHLPVILPIGLGIQDPDTPQREASQYRAFHLAHDAHRYWSDIQNTNPHSSKPVLAVYKDSLVTTTNGWIDGPDDLPRIATLTPPKRGTTRKATPVLRVPNLVDDGYCIYCDRNAGEHHFWSCTLA